MSKERDETGATLAFGADFNDVLVGDFTYGGGSMTLASDYTGTLIIPTLNGRRILNDGVNIVGGGVDSTFAGNGTLILKGSSRIDGAIGAVNSLSSVSIFNKAGGSVEGFGGTFCSKSLTLGEHSGTASFACATNIQNQVVFRALDQNLMFCATAILSDGVNFAGHAAQITVDSAAGNSTLMGALITTINNTGTLAVTGGSNTVTIIDQVGANGHAISSVTIADYTDAIFGSAVYTKDLTVGSGRVSFNGDVIISGKLTVKGVVAFSNYVDLEGAEVDISGGGDITFDRAVDITGCKFIGDLEHIHFLGDVIGEWQVEGLGFVDSDE